MKTTFTTIILGFGNNAGIEVPAHSIEALNAGKKPPVKVTVENYTYQSTVAVMSGKYMIALAKAHREASGLRAGDQVTVTLELESGIRSVEVPAELQKALDENNLADLFSQLSYSKRKEFARQVAETQSLETKARRIAKILQQLQ